MKMGFLRIGGLASTRSLWVAVLLGGLLCYSPVFSTGLVAQENGNGEAVGEEEEVPEMLEVEEEVFQEVYSNGFGGGRWSDPTTWFDEVVPGPDDIVVISRGDLVTVDMPWNEGDEPVIHCRRLYIDPRGVLDFQMRSQTPVGLRVGGRVEVAGTLRMHGANSSRDLHVFHLAAEDVEDRRIRMTPGSFVIFNGSPPSANNMDRRNVRLISEPLSLSLERRQLAELQAEVAKLRKELAELGENPDEEQAAPLLQAIQQRDQSITSRRQVLLNRERQVPASAFLVERGNFVDLQFADISNIEFNVVNVNSSGALASERFRLFGNRMTGLSRVRLNGTDGVEIMQNHFVGGDRVRADRSAFALSWSRAPRTVVQGNRFSDGYANAIVFQHTADASLIGNHFENLTHGISASWASNMLSRDNTFDRVQRGHTVRASGVILEGGWARDTNYPFFAWGGNRGRHQLSNFRDFGFSETIRELEARIAQLEIDLGELEGGTENPMHLVLNRDLESEKRRLGELKERQENRTSMRVQDSTTATLLNSNWDPEWLTLTSSGSEVDSLYFFVVGTDRPVPPEAMVEVVTVDPAVELPEGAIDLNIRNSPTGFLPQGVTAPPGTYRAITVKGWNKVRDTLDEGPLYEIRVVMPPSAPGGERRVLGTLRLRPGPEHYISNPRALQPNVTVPVRS